MAGSGAPKRGAWLVATHGNGRWMGGAAVLAAIAYYDIAAITPGVKVTNSFCDSGYDDIYASMFAPYDYDAHDCYLNVDDARWLRLGGASSQANADQLLNANVWRGQRDIAGLPINKIQRTVNDRGTTCRAEVADVAKAARG